MRRDILRLVAGAALAMVVVVGSAVDARAGTTYTPSGGTDAKLVGANVVFHFEEIGQDFRCAPFDIAGQVTSPGVARSFGTEAVDLGALTDTCTNPLWGLTQFSADPGWRLAVTGAAVGSAWQARLDQVAMTLSALNCTVAFGGAVDGTIDTASQRFTPATSALVVTSVTGSMCVMLDFQVGDHAVLLGSLTNLPPAGSGPLSIS